MSKKVLLILQLSCLIDFIGSINGTRQFHDYHDTLKICKFQMLQL
jgi:hypothetical protein